MRAARSQGASRAATVGVAAKGRVGAVGPAWTYDPSVEKPAGQLDMGGWVRLVYTAEQQARLGVDRDGKPAVRGPAPASRIVPAPRNVAGTTVLYQLPPAGTPAAQGAVLLFHGCSHSGATWWRLPESWAFARAMLRAGFAVVGFTSRDRRSGCWHAGADMPAVKQALARARAADAGGRLAALFARGVPVFAMGGSSGGTFVSQLASEPKRILGVPLAAVAVYISPGAPDEYGPANATPTVFVHMPRDTSWASTRNVEAAASALKGRGVAADVLACLPKPLEAKTFFERIDARQPFTASGVLHGGGGGSDAALSIAECDAVVDVIKRVCSYCNAASVTAASTCGGATPAGGAPPALDGEAVSRAVFEAFRRAGFLHDTTTGEFRTSPRGLPWKETLLQRALAGEGVTQGSAAFDALAANGWRDWEEVVNVLFARHEMTREHAGAVAAFFSTSMRSEKVM